MAYTDIDDPTAYFQTKIYTGNGANDTAITFDGNSNLQPDFLWIKNRSEAQSHALFDSVRGATKRVTSNGSGAESTENTNLDSFDTNGFTVDNELIVNGSSDLMVAWGWKANGSGSANTDGSISSTVSANTTSGFSIVKFTGNGSAGATIGHGLNSTPSMIILKDRDLSKNWNCYHKGIDSNPQNFTIRLNSSDAKLDTPSNGWNDTAPTSSVFSIGDGTQVNTSGSNMIAYCFAEKKGFSKFGSYTGNGNDNGTFVYTGFKPAFLLIKRTDSTGAWHMADSVRDPDNPHDHALTSNTSNAESTSATWFDILSNGIKLRYTGAHNQSGGNYIYMAFAENPFVTSTGIPSCAR